MSHSLIKNDQIKTCCDIINYHRIHQKWKEHDIEPYDLISQAFIHDHQQCIDYIRACPFDYNDTRYTYYSIVKGHIRLFTYLLEKGAPWVPVHSLLAVEYEHYDILYTALELGLPFDPSVLEHILQHQEYNVFTCLAEHGIKLTPECFKLLDKRYKVINLEWNKSMKNILYEHLDEVQDYPNLMIMIEDHERKMRSLNELIHYLLDPIIPSDVITYEILSFW